MPVSAQLTAWAGERNELVHHGSSVPPSARYQMAASGESLLAPGSDERLRVIVDGDLATASQVVVLVPGVDTKPETFDLPLPPEADLADAAAEAGSTAEVSGVADAVSVDGVDSARDLGGVGPSESVGDLEEEPIAWWRTMPGWARAIRQAAQPQAEDLAVVAWLGYVSPIGVNGANPEAMRQGAANLVAFDRFLRAARPNADTTWICHSYGSLVCASALPDADPGALILVGSPGVGARSVSELATDAPIWAGQTGEDLIGLTRLTAVLGGSFGPTPVSPKFGAQELPCDADGGHSDYFRPGSSQVKAMAQIATRHLGPPI
ncbi:MAG: alpha/beta hydrolase family protein [Bifidobacteriaceae bacterium]|jgi:hypothetical protein|nr:alpha/beta hydrolase family protein [Bifidobacteriaceae bacterium]